MSESFLMYYILKTPPQQYGPFNTLYTIPKNKWLISELMAMLVQEKERLVMKHFHPLLNKEPFTLYFLLLLLRIGIFGNLKWKMLFEL